MKVSPAFFTIILEIAFIVYCIHMTYLLDVQDPLPREWMIPNMLIGAAILAFGLYIATRLNRDPSALTDRE
jgi:multisubunit Na+/H+ antiporter MnhC subunit